MDEARWQGCNIIHEERTRNVQGSVYGVLRGPASLTAETMKREKDENIEDVKSRGLYLSNSIDITVSLRSAGLI